MTSKNTLAEKIYNVRDWLNSYKLSIEEAYSDLYNACMDYDYDLEDIFEDYITEDIAEEMAKHELESWGLARLYHFMWDVNFCCCDLFRVNGYWNLEEVDHGDIENIISEIEDRTGITEDDIEEEDDEEEEETTEEA